MAESKAGEGCPDDLEVTEKENVPEPTEKAEITRSDSPESLKQNISQEPEYQMLSNASEVILNANFITDMDGPVPSELGYDKSFENASSTMSTANIFVLDSIPCQSSQSSIEVVNTVVHTDIAGQVDNNKATISYDGLDSNSQSSLEEVVSDVTKLPVIGSSSDAGLFKRPAPVDSGSGYGMNSSIATQNEVLISNDLEKRKKVDIYTKDTYPKWHDVHGNNVTQTIDPKKLPEAFDYLPIFGRPLCSADLPAFQESKIREFIGCGVSDEEYAKLENYCSPNHLRTGNELTLLSSLPNQGISPHGIDSNAAVNSLNDEDASSDHNMLCVVKKFKMRLEKDLNNSFPKKLKYRGIRMLPLMSERVDDVPADLNSEDTLHPGMDLVYRIRIYRPFAYNNKERAFRIRHSIFSRDVVLLGRQRLWELRDRIVCPNDLDVRLDVSERIDDPPLTTAKELFPSGFLFINNVFYVDSRPGCADMSERVREWAERRGLGAFPRRDLSDRLHDLPVRLGHPEVYVHQGNCEHLFTVSEIRLLHSSDPLHLSDYPAHTAISQNQTVYCTTCAEFGAKWIVVGCARVPFDPAYFCDTCLRLYLYKDGQKIENFKAYSYRGNDINMLKPQG